MPLKLSVGKLAVPLALFTAACSAHPSFSPLPSPTGEAPEATVFLIGDAGAVDERAPVLDRLSARSAEAAERAPTVVAFLGDNIYPAGVRADEPGFTADTLMLGRQMRAVAGTGAGAVFLPGNHDWDNGGPDALGALARQQAWLETNSPADAPVTLLPAGGCPGPEVMDLPGVRLVLVDTQWFLHDHARGCEDTSPSAAAAAITAAIDAAGDEPVMVLSHHPMRTHGTHGGFFSARSHLFPLVDFVPWAWVPLPVVGTGYVLLRQNGFTDQDLSGGGNEAMRELLEGAFRASRRPPAIHAAGHEHSLEVLEGDAAGPTLYLVSGAGSKSTAVGRGGDTLRAAEVPGFMQVDVFAGYLRVTVVAVEGEDRGGPGDVGACFQVNLTDRRVVGCS